MAAKAMEIKSFIHIFDGVALTAGAINILLQQFNTWQSAMLFILLFLYGVARLWYYVKDKETKRKREAEKHSIEIELLKIDLDDAKKNVHRHLKVA